MSKKYFNVFGIVGILLVIVGVLSNSNIISNFKLINSEWTIIKLSLLSYYLLSSGLIIVVGFLVFNKSKKENFLQNVLIILSFVGIAIVFCAVYFNPNYVEANFSTTKFLGSDEKGRLLVYQQFAIIIGTLLGVFSLIIFSKITLKSFKVISVLILFLGLVIYLVLVQTTYINTKYPSNLILNSKELPKVVKLLLGQDILLSDYEPRSTLIVKNKKILKAKFPVIDFNFHLSSAFRTAYDDSVLSPENLLKSMDSLNIKTIINTDVENQDLDKVLNKFARKYPGKFINFWPTGFPPGIMSDERIAALAGELEKVVKMGAKGDGELWKHLGLKTRDSSGKLLAVDDPRIDPFWDKAGELGIPVLWHMGDPTCFFQPIDRFNERFRALGRIPEWSYYGPQFPKHEVILKQRENVFKKHPNTIFVGCHVGFTPNDLEYTSYLLDTYPNYYVEISTVLSDLGRQPYTARKFFIKYQDRILFGTDGGSEFGQKGWTIEKYYRTHFEFLETENEFFEYPLQGVIDQGNWKIYGINLPDEVLEKVYHLNAEKLLSGNKQN
ncbi:MAG: amidohydrolase family protein [Melioribacteraceae bacterium]